ncbi:MAG: CheR family methyltransferase [Turneriella sp.]
MHSLADTETIPLTDREFAEFQRLIYDLAGIHMTDAKKALISGRLMKRLRHYALRSFSAYLAIVTDSANIEERQTMVNLLTTNETYFFREPKHFDWLRERLRKRSRAERFRLWSAACSSGQEVYSLAMVIADEIGNAPWEIYASDISEKMLTKAVSASYDIEQAEQIPEAYLKRFCLRGIRGAAGSFCIQPELLQHIHFYRINLVETLPEDFGKFDVIFLRNVMIYFDRDTRRRVTESLLNFLKPEGNLVIGHAESLLGITDRLQAVRPTIYMKKNETV